MVIWTGDGFGFTFRHLLKCRLVSLVQLVSPSTFWRDPHGYTATVPKTVPNPEPMSAQSSPTPTKLEGENLNETRVFTCVYARR